MTKAEELKLKLKNSRDRRLDMDAVGLARSSAPSEESSGKRRKGRPPKGYDPAVVFKLARMQCTIVEIAAFFDMSAEVLSKKTGFHEAYERGLEHGKQSLRRSLFRRAMDGNVSLSIWLSKQYLGFKEPRSEHTLAGEDGKPITFRVVYDKPAGSPGGS